MSKTKQTLNIDYVSRVGRPLHPLIAILAYALTLGAFCLLLIAGRLPDSLLVLFVIPIVVSPLFSYDRRVYLPMVGLLTVGAVWVTSILSSSFQTSLLTIVFSSLSSIAMAEIISYLLRLRRLAEEALRDSEERHRIISSLASDFAASFRLGPDGRLVPEWLTGAFTRITGYTPEEINALGGLMGIIHPDDRHIAEQGLDAAMDGESYVDEYRIITREGRVRWLRDSGFATADPAEPQVLHLYRIAQDVTTQKQAAEQIVHLNTVLRAIRNVNQLITRERDQDRLLQGACNSLIETRGYRCAWIVLVDASGAPTAAFEAGWEKYRLREQIQTRSLPHCIVQALTQEALVVIQAASVSCCECPLYQGHKETGTLAVRLAHQDQVYGALAVSLSADLAVTNEEQSLFIEVASDIAFALYSIGQGQQRRRAESQRDEVLQAISWQAQVNAALAQLTKAVLGSLAIEDISNLVLQDANTLTGSAIGYVGYIDQRTGHLVCPAMSREAWVECQPPEQTSRFSNFRGLWGWVLQNQQPLLSNQAAADPRAAGVPPGHQPIHRLLSVPVLAGDRLLGQISVANAEIDYEQRDLNILQQLADIYAVAVQRCRLEEQLLQSQKMEAVGRLAGGIAHDFNNHLTAITGYSELLLGDICPENPLRPDIEAIRRAAESSASLTRQLLAFSRKQILESRVFDLNQLLIAIENMLHRLLGEHIQLELDLAAAPGNIRADYGQLEQVVMNLVVNARDAMPDGGHLVIRTALVHADQIALPYRLLVPDGTYASLSVTDDGIGMDDEVQSHLFEPFFTTKEEGKGTGLGLATVYGIVKQSGGYIFCDSERGRGTCFTIYLPHTEPGDRAQGGIAQPTSALEGTETILLVEDEDSVRALSRRILQRQGYTVLEACNAVEALGLCREYGGPIHLILTDVIMPGGDGRTMVSQVAACRPGIKVLYMSGYTDDLIAPRGLIDANVRLLPKPFTPEALLRHVREALQTTS